MFVGDGVAGDEGGVWGGYGGGEAGGWGGGGGGGKRLDVGESGNACRLLPSTRFHLLFLF